MACLREPSKFQGAARFMTVMSHCPIPQLISNENRCLFLAAVLDQLGLVFDGK